MCQGGIGRRVPPAVFRLSELLKRVQPDCDPPADLPLLCQRVWEKKKGRRACKRALRKIKSLLKKCRNEPFTSCCCYGLKVIPFKSNEDDAYLVHTRNIVPDYVHLEEVAKLLQQPLEYVERQLWELVPALDETFAEDAMQAIQRRAAQDVHPDEVSTAQKNILIKQGEKVKLLASAYAKRFPQDHPAFDVAIYNMLKGSKLSNRDYEGLVKTVVSVRVDQDFCIVRIIMKNLGPPSDEPPLPIVGMAFSGHGFPKECLENGLVEEFGRILLGKWKNAKWTSDTPLPGPDNKWDAAVSIRLNNEPDERLLEDIELAHKVAIHVAGNTLGAFLLKQLQHEPDQFIELLNAVTGPKMWSTEGARKKTLWSQILEDLLVVSGSKFSLESLRSKQDVIERVFKIPGRYSPLTPAIPADDLVDEERRQLLFADLCDKGSRYEEIVEVKLIPYGMELSHCDPNLLAHYLESYSKSYEDSVVDAFAAQAVEKERDCDKKVWDSVGRFCTTKDSYHVLEKVYAATLKGSAKVIYYLCTEAFGMLVTGLTVGIIPWYWVADKMGRRITRDAILEKASIKDSAGSR